MAKESENLNYCSFPDTCGSVNKLTKFALRLTFFTNFKGQSMVILARTI
jgi:hypothetical protein